MLQQPCRATARQPGTEVEGLGIIKRHRETVGKSAFQLCVGDWRVDNITSTVETKPAVCKSKTTSPLCAYQGY